MLTWLKSLIPTPKKVIGQAVDALDLLVPLMASEIEKIKQKFNEMDSRAKAQWVVDKVQDYLRKQWKLDA